MRLYRYTCLIDSDPSTGDIAREIPCDWLGGIWNQRGDRVQASARLAVEIPAGHGVGSGDGPGMSMSQVATSPDLPSCRTEFDRDTGERRTDGARPSCRPGKRGNEVERSVVAEDEKVCTVATLLGPRKASNSLKRRCLPADEMPASIRA